MSGEKVSEEQVANLLAILRTDAQVDAKVSQINHVKSGIKQNNVPEACILPIFEATRTAMTSQHAAIVNAAFSTLSHLLTRLSRQEPKYVIKEAGRTLPLVIEKMGDQKEKYRQLAAQCLTTFWKQTPLDVERIVKNAGLVGKNSRMKEASMNWIVQMHEEHRMPFKSYVTTFMDLLEDADGIVRDTARNSVIALFQNAPNAAKSDLKKQLKNFNVRPTIVTTIVGHLGPGGPPETVESDLAEAPRPTFANSISSVSSMRPTTPTVEAKVEHVDPAYVNTQRELEDTFKDMHPYFEGKESEANWLKREQSCTKIRRLNAGNAPSDFHDTFLICIKGLLDGILKAVNSLRTSLSKEGCSVVQEVARTAGSGLDPMVEILLQNLIKLCGGTKKISSQQGNVTVDIIVGKVSYNIRIMQHIWAACQDKNVQPRTYATGWLKTLLKKEAHHKSHVEHTGGLELVEKCVKKGLADANPGVRENMRSTYWAFAAIWPIKAEAIMATLDATQQRLLENSPDNPNSPKKADPVSRPGLGFSKSTNAPPKPSLRETMLAQKKAAMANKNLPPRPGSAMSSFSPMRTVSSSSTVSTSSDSAPVKGKAESTTVAHGGLSVAPMRPKFRPAPRPELVPRPATAGPYSVRRPGHGPSNSDTSASPSITTKAQKVRTTSVASNSPPKRGVAARPTTSHSSHSHASQSSQNSPARSTVSKAVPSPRGSPVKPKVATRPAVSSSPSKADEEFTLVVPTIGGFKEPSPMKNSETIDSSEDDDIVTPLRAMKVYEDPFSSTDDQTTPRPTITAPILEEVPVNEDASNLIPPQVNGSEAAKAAAMSPEKLKQNSRLLESGISKIRAQSLDVHGFRKLQGMIRDNKADWSNDKFDSLLLGLFSYLEAPVSTLSPEKVQDVKAQILATIKLMFKKDREAFRPHVSTGLESVLTARRSYEARTHIVSGLELLSNDLIAIADPEEATHTITSRLAVQDMTVEGCRSLSMGLHMLTELLNEKKDHFPSEKDLNGISKLASSCLESTESGVRMDAVHLCVSVHARVGETMFWKMLGGVKDDPKSLITYYIVKRQREAAIS